MTFIPNVTGIVSTGNSSTSPLGLGAVFTGTSENVAFYSAVEVIFTTDVDTAPLGVSFQFSADGSTWTQYRTEFTHTIGSSGETFTKKVPTKGEFFRLVLTNGGTAQSSLLLQTRLYLTTALPPMVPGARDAFGRLRVSNPSTQVDLSFIEGRNVVDVWDDTTGTGVISNHTPSSTVTLATTGAGSAVIEARKRGVYQPGKSLLVYMTGVLNANSNAATTISRIGYFDDNNGYYFQFEGGVVSLVQRSTSTGALVNTIVAQSSWNANQLMGAKAQPVLDPTRTLIFYFSLEWLGVGFVDCGVIINGTYWLCHRFLHSNLLTTTYMKQASLPLRWSIDSTAGAGTVRVCCGTVISEGGFSRIGRIFSANRGTTSRVISNVKRPIFAIRLQSTADANQMAFVVSASVMITNNANSLVELWRFVDTAPGSVLSGPAPTWTAANAASAVEFSINATTFTPGGGTGFLVKSQYTSNNNDNVNFTADETSFISFNGTKQSDLLILAGITTATNNENFYAALTWQEIL